MAKVSLNRQIIAVPIDAPHATVGQVDVSKGIKPNRSSFCDKGSVFFLYFEEFDLKILYRPQKET